MAIQTEAELIAILDRAIAEHFVGRAAAEIPALEVDVPDHLSQVTLKATISGYSGSDSIRMEFK